MLHKAARALPQANGFTTTANCCQPPLYARGTESDPACCSQHLSPNESLHSPSHLLSICLDLLDVVVWQTDVTVQVATPPPADQLAQPVIGHPGQPVAAAAAAAPKGEGGQGC